MSKYLAIGLVVAVSISILLGKLYVNANAARAVAESANEVFEEKLASQVRELDRTIEQFAEERAALQEVTRLEGELRGQLRDEVTGAVERAEGAAALMTDDEWWCASELIPDVYLDGLHDDNSTI